MKNILKDVWSELKLVLSGHTLDILFPPILFLVLNNLISTTIAIVGSSIFGILVLIRRILKHDKIYYAIGGLVGIIVANISIYINQNTSNYFLPDLLSTFGLIIITLVSLVLNKPLAIWVSHITRGWPLEWFYRKDILPAYREVSIFWLIFFLIRFSLEMYLYLTSTLETLVFFNVMLGFPMLIGVLTISYIYGITRLKSLKGPSVDEFMNGEPKPWQGQRKGF